VKAACGKSARAVCAAGGGEPFNGRLPRPDRLAVRRCCSEPWSILSSSCRSATTPTRRASLDASGWHRRGCSRVPTGFLPSTSVDRIFASVQLNARKSGDLAKSKAIESELWRHADDDPEWEGLWSVCGDAEGHDQARGQGKVRLAPFIGIGCPGRSREGGSIERAVKICRATGSTRVSTCLTCYVRRFPKLKVMR
jgi:hypothetical protein